MCLVKHKEKRRQCCFEIKNRDSAVWRGSIGALICHGIAVCMQYNQQRFENVSDVTPVLVNIY